MHTETINVIQRRHYAFAESNRVVNEKPKDVCLHASMHPASGSEAS